MSSYAAGVGEVVTTGEVVPFEAVPAQPVDPQLAWQGAVAALQYFNPKMQAIRDQMPLDWPSLVSTYEPTAALSFSVGNFPQLVRNLQSLLLAEKLSSLRLQSNPAANAVFPFEWAMQLAEKRQYPQVLTALGVLRLGRQFASAAELIRRHSPEVPAPWRAAWANEEASLAWHGGQAEEAAKLWRDQADNVPVLFNRGMAALFLDEPTDARRWLNQAVTKLPEDDAWHHLGRLYLALAEMRG
jgi:hypothetical protein